MKNYIGFRAWDMGFDAHMTLIYTGSLEPAQEILIETTIRRYQWDRMDFWVSRNKIELFGPNNDIPVLTVFPNLDLHHLRQKLLKLDIPNPSEYEWNPHITLKLDHWDTIHLPTRIKLDKLGLY